MAGNEGWAKFDSLGAAPKEDQDDNWGDFGGFETAQLEPGTDPQASNTSGLISWATTFGTQTSSAKHESLNSSVPPDVIDASQWASFSSEVTATQENLETIVKQVPNTSDSSSSVSDGLTSKSDLHLEKQTADFSTNQEYNKQAEKSDTSFLHKHTEDAQKAAEKINALEEKLSLAEQEKLKLKEEFENLARKHQELEKDSKTAQENLEDQKEKYAKLQEEHREQLQGLRQAGHDTLAIIVEEYKKLSRQAVLEERERSRAEIHTFLEEERKKFQEILVQQEKSFETTLTLEREKIDERVKAALQEEHQKNKLAIESALDEERNELRGVLEMAIKVKVGWAETTLKQAEKIMQSKQPQSIPIMDMRQQGEDAVKAAVVKEKEMHLALMEKMENTIKEEREKSKISIKQALYDERQQSKIAIQEAMEEERKNFREATNRSLEENKSSMNEYIKVKQQMDSQVQQKQYLTLDLFLESARTQLKSLIEGNPKC